MKSKSIVLWSLAAGIMPFTTYLYQTPTDDLNLMSILSTLIYGVIGILLCLAGYVAFDRMIGLDLRRELVEDQNIALGIMLAGVFIGIAIIISTAIR